MAHVAAICNTEEQLNRLYTVDTVYAILDYNGVREEVTEASQFQGVQQSQQRRQQAAQGDMPRMSDKQWLGIVTVASVDAALAGNRDLFVDDLKNTIDRVLTDPAEYHQHGRLRHIIESFSNTWELNFEWSTAQWVSGTYRGFRVGVPFPYDGDPTKPRIRRLGFYRAHVAAICNEEEQLNRLHTVDTLYAILDYIGLSD